MTVPNAFLLILQVAVIVLLAQAVGSLFRRIGQPQVMGEMVAGIMLGPSLFGWLAPGASAMLFPPDSVGYLSALSQIGLILFMFLVGLSIKPGELRRHANVAVLISHGSIASLFALTAVLALLLYPRLSDGGVSFIGFALFLGAAMSISAFPILARLLFERDLLKTRLGTLAITCAAVDYVTVWSLLAYIIVLARPARAGMPPWLAPIGLAIFVAFMAFYARRRFRAFETAFLNRGALSHNAVTALVLVVFASALVTEALGVHVLFGAFLAGAIMPENAALSAHIRNKIEPLTLALLLPLFFALTGLRTRIDLISGPEMWTYCALIVAVAVAGKLGASAVAARVAGMNWREAGALGVLLNTRGLMEIVILNIGLDIQIIAPSLFSMMVIMALVTTLMTAPVLDLINSAALRAEPGGEIEGSLVRLGAGAARAREFGTNS